MGVEPKSDESRIVCMCARCQSEGLLGHVRKTWTMGRQDVDDVRLLPLAGFVCKANCRFLVLATFFLKRQNMCQHTCCWQCVNKKQLTTVLAQDHCYSDNLSE